MLIQVLEVVGQDSYRPGLVHGPYTNAVAAARCMVQVYNLLTAYRRSFTTKRFVDLSSGNFLNLDELCPTFEHGERPETAEEGAR